MIGILVSGILSLLGFVALLVFGIVIDRMISNRVSRDKARLSAPLWGDSGECSRANREGALSMLRDAKGRFEVGVDSAREQLKGTRAESGIHLLNTISRLLEPLHYGPGIEGAICLYLGAEGRILDVQSWVGDAISVPMPPDQIAERAVDLRAEGVVLGHNHPNERPVPSDQDVWHAAGLEAILVRNGIRLAEDYVWCHNQYKSVLNTRRFKALVRPV